jgi:ribokinase
MVQLTVVGSLNYDLVTYTQRVPDSGETYQADSFETHIGGKGLNQTISIAKLIPEINEKHRVRMIGSVGDDSFGEQLKSSLIEYGVNVDDVKVHKGVRSGVATILVEKSTGENRILITAGANANSEFSNDQLERLFPELEETEVVVLQNEIPGSLGVMKWLKTNRSNTEIIYNPSPYYSYSTEVLNLVDVLIVNENESLAIAKDILPDLEYQTFEKSINEDQITGFSKLSQTLTKSISGTGSKLVIITLGAIGSIAAFNNTTSFIESVKPEKVIDTTGAGDTFLGAFITQHYLKTSVKDSMQFASFASSLAIQKNGASDSIPTYQEVVSAQGAA